MAACLAAPPLLKDSVPARIPESGSDLCCSCSNPPALPVVVVPAPHLKMSSRSAASLNTEEIMEAGAEVSECDKRAAEARIRDMGLDTRGEHGELLIQLYSGARSLMGNKGRISKKALE